MFLQGFSYLYSVFYQWEDLLSLFLYEGCCYMPSGNPREPCLLAVTRRFSLLSLGWEMAAVLTSAFLDPYDLVFQVLSAILNC